MSPVVKCYFNWSSGKDASLALYHLKQDTRFEVDRLLTSVNGHYNRVSMHGLRIELLERQAQALGLDLTQIQLPAEPSMEDYNHIIGETVKELKAEGYHNCGFGDIFLEDLRQYREEQLIPIGIKCHFPLWKRDTQEVINEFIDLGFKAVVNCVDARYMSEEFVGRELDHHFIKDLPKSVDPCGENGEFHTFCYDGPIFSNPIKFTTGAKTYRSYPAPDKDIKQEYGFWFCDLIP